MSNGKWKKEHTQVLHVRYSASTGIPDAIACWMNDHNAEYTSEFLKEAIEEKLSAEGYILSNNPMYRLRKSAHEYGITIIEWVAEVLEERRRLEEQFPDLGHMSAADAVREAYSLSHPNGI